MANINVNPYKDRVVHEVALQAAKISIENNLPSYKTVDGFKVLTNDLLEKYLLAHEELKKSDFYND